MIIFAKHASNTLGSDNTCIARDIKTFRGMQNRICKGVYPYGQWEVYACHDDAFYDESRHRHIGTFRKVKPFREGGPLPTGPFPNV